jgi:hypothetical protein
MRAMERLELLLAIAWRAERDKRPARVVEIERTIRASTEESRIRAREHQLIANAKKRKDQGRAIIAAIRRNGEMSADELGPVIDRTEGRAREICNDMISEGLLTSHAFARGRVKYGVAG